MQSEDQENFANGPSMGFNQRGFWEVGYALQLSTVQAAQDEAQTPKGTREALQDGAMAGHQKADHHQGQRRLQHVWEGVRWQGSTGGS